MNLDRAILLDLVPGQATAAAIGEHLGYPEETILTALRRLHSTALVEPLPVSILTAWRLTPKALQLHADSLRTNTKP